MSTTTTPEQIVEGRRKTLQERLGTLIESNLSLENRANLLELQMKEINASNEANVREIKKFYESEMCEARRLLNAQAEDRARLDMSHSKELKRREELDLENGKLNELVTSLKEEKTAGFDLNDQTSVDLAAEKRLTEKLREEIDGWKDEANIYHNKLTNMKTAYEAEILSRVDAENKVQGLEETISLNNRMFTEIAAQRVATQPVVAEVQQTQVAEMAEEYAAIFDEQLKAFDKERSKTNEKYEERITTLKGQFKEAKENSTRVTAELEVCQVHIKKTETQLDEHQKQHDTAEEELRIELEHEKSNNDALSSELKELKEKMTANEAAAQTENEVSIKSELNTFESLLECEEERLGLANKRKRDSDEAPTDDTEQAEKQAKMSVAKGETKKCVIM